MTERNILRTGIFVIIMAAVSGCVKYPPYEFPEDKVDTRKNNNTLELNNQLSSDSIDLTVRWLQSMGTRFALADNRKTIAIKVRDRFINMGYSDSHLDSFPITKTWNSKVYSLMQYNVITELRGSRYPDSLMIIGAHYDAYLTSGDPFTSTPGANDNAGGVAALFEIARVMKQKDYRPLATIQFIAFGAEEMGLLGSFNYASKPGVMGRPVKLMVNNDMIANVSDLNPLSWKVNIISYSNSRDVLSKSKSLCIKYTDIKYANDTTYYNRSDSYPFFLRGYKTVFFMSNSTYPFYHTSNDTFFNCNFDFCREVAALSCALLVWSDTHEL